MHEKTSPNAAHAVLWASAFLITAMIIVQAGRLPGHPAHAQMAVTKGDYSLVTTEYGRGENRMLYVVNSRDQVMMAYEIEDAQQKVMVLRDGGSIENLFRSARR